MRIIDEDLESLSGELRAAGKRIVFTNGCFDLLHVGHIRYLRQARDLGDCLIVGLNSDASVRALKGESRPVNSEDERAELLDALKAVDYVALFSEPTAERLIRCIRPHVYAKGGDYCVETLPEAQAVRDCGGIVRLLPFSDGRSTTGLIEKIKAL